MVDNLSEIQSQHADIMTRIAQAAKHVNRKAQDIELVAVSKVQPDERVETLLGLGHAIYGENRVQEAQTRWGERFKGERKNIELRLIGPLQSNKVEDAVHLFDVIETIDREKLLKALVKLREAGVLLPRLYVQVNTGEETQKSGVLPKDLPDFITLMRDTYNLKPEGVTCIPPLKEAASPHFWLLRKLAGDVGVERLSMGMSGDFETAIKMGASSIRVGSALFGDRKPS